MTKIAAGSKWILIHPLHISRAHDDGEVSNDVFRPVRDDVHANTYIVDEVRASTVFFHYVIELGNGEELDSYVVSADVDYFLDAMMPKRDFDRQFLNSLKEEAEITVGSVWYFDALPTEIYKHIDRSGLKAREDMTFFGDNFELFKQIKFIVLSVGYHQPVKEPLVEITYRSSSLFVPVEEFKRCAITKRERDRRFLNGLKEDILLEDIPAPGTKRVAVIIGRFNPPTKGHYELINEVRKLISKKPEMKLEAYPVVIVIGNDKKKKSGEDLLKNPLSVHDRITFMQSSGHTNGVKFISATNAFEALSKCRTEGLEPIAIAAGTDRIDDYIRILDQYFKDINNKPIKHQKIHLARDEHSIEQNKAEKANNIDDQLASIKAGEDITVDIVSGTLARRAAELGYFEEFTKIVGLEQNTRLAKLLYDKVKKILELANQQTEKKDKE